MTIDHKVLVDSEIAGYRIPKGMLVCGRSRTYTFLRISIEYQFPLFPETFKPERFIQPDGTFLRHEQLINFSIGKSEENYNYQSLELWWLKPLFRTS